jgi:hypothetical protein
LESEGEGWTPETEDAIERNEPDGAAAGKSTKCITSWTLQQAVGLSLACTGRGELCCLPLRLGIAAQAAVGTPLDVSIGLRPSLCCRSIGCALCARCCPSFTSQFWAAHFIMISSNMHPDHSTPITDVAEGSPHEVMPAPKCLQPNRYGRCVS